MFKKAERLSRAQFTPLFKTGTRYQTPALTLIYRSDTPLKVAVVVGKKVFKRAVDRNRTRRRIYAAMYRHFTAQNIKIGSYIIITKPLITTFTRAETGAAIDSLLALINNPR